LAAVGFAGPPLEKRGAGLAARSVEGGTKNEVFTAGSVRGAEKKRTSMNGRPCARVKYTARILLALNCSAVSRTPFPARKSVAVSFC